MRVLLILLRRLHPRGFRREHGEEWMDAALEGLDRFRTRGNSCPRLKFLLFLLGDSARSLPRIWLDALAGVPPAEGRRAVSWPIGKADFMDTWIQDLRFGLRTLLRRPLFALLVISTLGLGIGATTAIFSVVEGVLLTPPPFQRPSELVSVYKTRPAWQNIPALAPSWDLGMWPYPGYERWRARQTRFIDVAIHGSTARNLTREGDPERVMVGIASSSLFPVLGAQPNLGRGFTPAEDRADAPLVALLSHGFWQKRFGGRACWWAWEGP